MSASLKRLFDANALVLVCICIYVYYVCCDGQDEIQKRACDLVSTSDTFRQMVNTKIRPEASRLRDDTKIDLNMREMIVNARGEFGYVSMIAW